MRQLNKTHKQAFSFYVIFEVFSFLLILILLLHSSLNSNTQFQFDKNIIIFKIFQKMGKKCAVKQLKRVATVEKQIIYEDCSDVPTKPYIQNPIKEEVVFNIKIEHQKDSPDSQQPKNSKKIEKNRKKRTFDPQARFLPQHIKRFFLFPFLYATSFPFTKISWEYWKPSGYFIKMSEYLSNISPQTPDKTSDQCKSFDERQKKEIYKDVDLLQAAFSQLQKHPLDSISLKICSDFIDKMEEQSEYMKFLSQNQLHPNPPSTQKRYALVYPSQKRQTDSNEFFDQEDQIYPCPGV